MQLKLARRERDFLPELPQELSLERLRPARALGLRLLDSRAEPTRLRRLLAQAALLGPTPVEALVRALEFCRQHLGARLVPHFPRRRY
jgi:hypothetical protein